MAGRNLTDRTMKALRPKGRRYDVRDALTPGLVVRVGETGSRIFTLQARFPGRAGRAERRTLGHYPELTLEDARRKAREWRTLLRRGIDPSLEEKRARENAENAAANTVARVAEDFFAHIRAAVQRRADAVERQIRRHVLGAWGGKPIASITHEDVVGLVQGIAKRPARTIGKRTLKPAPTTARSVLGDIRALFSFAVEHRKGITASPCATVRPKKQFGPKKSRKRVLDNGELGALWGAAGRLPAPWSAFYRLLTLTGQRRDEVGSMRWREVDLAAALWTVPPERFKSDQWHLVPLSTQAVAVLRELQAALLRVDRDAFVFSTTGGMKAIAGFGKVKARLDALMVADLGRPLGESFVNHDIRRTVRTRLSEIGIRTEVAELVIGHTKGGLIGTYDMHQFLDERRAALQAWADRLDRIAAPQANVVELAAARSAS